MYAVMALLGLTLLTWGVAVWASFESGTPGHREQPNGQQREWRKAA